MKIYIITFWALLLCLNLKSQSIFDKVEQKLINNLSISVGAQFTWYKNSNIHFVQTDYERNFIIHDAKATGRGRFNEFFKGKFGCSQYRIDLSYRLSQKYLLQLEVTHLDYLVDLGRTYYQLGEWDGERINEISDLTKKFTLLEHSNGINIWKFGLLRQFAFSKSNKISLKSGFQFGIVMSATQANIYSPYNDLEMYDPGNKFAGFNYSFHSELIFRMNKRIDIYFNFTYFQMNLNKALINEDSYVSQSIGGSNSGINIRYRI